MRIGVYDLGAMVVRLDVRKGLGAEFDMGARPQARICVGLGGSWPEVVSRLFHEAFEAVSAVSETRWRPGTDYSYSASNWLFVLTHEQMAEAVAQVGHFAAKVLPALAKAYRAVNRKPKHKPKRR